MRHSWSKILNKTFLVLNLNIFVSSQNFAVPPFRKCWFQIYQWFSKIIAQKYPNNAFSVRKLRTFLFREILQFDEFKSAERKYYNIVFKFQPKIRKSGLFGAKFTHFCFFTKNCSYTNSNVLISIMGILFPNSSRKILKSGIIGAL